jgi:hypothetical protein
MRRTTRIALSTILAAIAWVTSAGLIARAADVTPPSPPSAPGNPTDRVPEGSAKGRGADAAIDLGEAKTGSAEQTVATGRGDSLQTRFNLGEGLVGETTDRAFRYHLGGRFD